MAVLFGDDIIMGKEKKKSFRKEFTEILDIVNRYIAVNYYPKWKLKRAKLIKLFDKVAVKPTKEEIIILAAGIKAGEKF